MDYIVHGIAGQYTWVGSLSLLQGIFLTQGSNQGLPHFRRILYQLSHQGRPRILEWVAYPFSRGSSQPRNRTRVSCIAGGFFISWAIREAHGAGGHIQTSLSLDGIPGVLSIRACSATTDALQPHGLYVACQAPLSMGFSRQEYWNGLPFPSPGDLPNPGIKPTSPVLAGRFFTTEPPRKPLWAPTHGESFRVLPLHQPDLKILESTVFFKDRWCPT